MLQLNHVEPATEDDMVRCLCDAGEDYYRFECTNKKIKQQLEEDIERMKEELQNMNNEYESLNNGIGSLNSENKALNEEIARLWALLNETHRNNYSLIPFVQYNRNRGNYLFYIF